MDSMEVVTFRSVDFGQIRTLLIDNEPWFVGKDVAGDGLDEFLDEFLDEKYI